MPFARRPDDIASGEQLAVGNLPHRLPVRRLLSFYGRNFLGDEALAVQGVPVIRRPSRTRARARARRTQRREWRCR